MKQYITFLILNLFLISGYSQIVVLDIKNPAPRVGEDIPIGYDIKWSDKKIVFPISPDELREIDKNKIGSGTLNLEKYAKDTGKLLIGPLTLEINGEIFKSDTLLLNIYPKLPNAKNGFWTRFIKYRGQYYFITEQRIGGEWKQKKNSKNSYSMTFDSDGVEFAEIPSSSIKLDNIEISFSYSSSSSQTIEGEKVLGAGTVHYKIYVYRVDLKDDYNNDFVLKKHYFINFPKGQDFEPIQIKK